MMVTDVRHAVGMIVFDIYHNSRRAENLEMWRETKYLFHSRKQNTFFRLSGIKRNVKGPGVQLPAKVLSPQASFHSTPHNSSTRSTRDRSLTMAQFEVRKDSNCQLTARQCPAKVLSSVFG